MGGRFSKLSKNRTHRKGKGKSKGKGKAPRISGPTGGLQMIPTPQRDESGRPVLPQSFEINKEQLIRAFEYMADYIHRQGTTLTIYIAGGAVNTIYLHSRHTTGDVDFFGSNEHSRLLKDASKHAQERSQARLGANWFNNSMSLFLTRDIEQDLIQASLQQNTIVFNRPGLLVYAVCWEYALCGKADRLGKPTRREYDIGDAVAFLHQYVSVNGGIAVRAEQVEAWTSTIRRFRSALWRK